MVGRVVAAPLVAYGQFIRHDPQKLARVLSAIALEAVETGQTQSPAGEDLGLVRTDVSERLPCVT
jgi:hypothetical protein